MVTLIGAGVLAVALAVGWFVRATIQLGHQIDAAQHRFPRED
jgi:hypothetical protein